MRRPLRSDRWGIRHALPTLWMAVSCACIGGCTEPTQRASLRVLVDADSAVRAHAEDVTVLIESQGAPGDGWETEAMRRYAPRIEHPWPLDITLKEVNRDATFQVTATALDKRMAVVGQVRSQRSFRDGLRLTMRVMFEESCLRRTPLCGTGETCHGGDCIDARSEIMDVEPKTDIGTADAGMTPVVTTPAVVTDGEGCDSEGTHACAGENSRIPLRCEGGMWKAEPQCGEAELCDATPGAQRGSCRRIASECLGRELNAEFCDRDVMRVCTNMFESMERPCVDNARCVSPAQNAMCSCRMGFVEQMGICRRATDCTMENGGCDPLTTCSVASGTVSCGKCPQGYFGDGMTGCTVPLTGLAASDGKLSPAFDPSVTDYTLEVPLLVQRVTLTPSSGGGDTIALNGQDLSESGTWTSPTLPFGEYPIELTVTAPSGTARTYKIRVKRTGKQTAYVKASNPDSDDYFGTSVAVDGDTIAVGAYCEDSGATGINGDGNNESNQDAGAVYVYVRKAGGWEQQAYLKTDETATRDYFGLRLALSRDTLVVGAPRYDFFPLSTASPGRGAAYVFERKAGNWQQTQVLTPSRSANGDQFGFAIAISGETMVISAANEDGQGAAYVFTRGSDGWRESARRAPQKRPGNAWFGSAVELDGDTAVVGAQNDSSDVRLAGSAYVFERSGGMWNEVQRLAPNPASEAASFGYSLALDGPNLLVGAPRYDSINSLNDNTAPGEVFAFQRVGGSWQQTQMLKAMLPRNTDSFGSSLDMRGSSALIGACGDRSGAHGIGADASRDNGKWVGAGYLYALEGQVWRQSTYFKASNGESADSLGLAAALSDRAVVLGAVWEDGGSRGVNGADNESAARSGAVYVFE